MIILDCETLETAVASVEEICGIPESTIRSVLGELDVETFLTEHPHYPKMPDEIVHAALIPHQTRIPTVDRCYWFHLSRVLDPQQFAAGIFPLGDRLDTLWTELGGLAANLVLQAEWESFRSGSNRNRGHSDFLFGLKTRNSEHWGPFAILVRNAAFRSREIGNHDYLDVPEIVEDICSSFAATFGSDLLSEFKSRAHPCIVKFWDGPPHDGALKAAINYIHTELRGEKMSISTNTCLDCRGTPIGPERIARIEVVAHD